MKVTKTYSIEKSVYDLFDSITSEKNINKSSFIVNCIKKFLNENGIDFLDKQYVLRTNQDHIVTVISEDDTYCTLSDGSKIQKILFMQLFIEFNGIDPEDFFSKSNEAINDAVEKIKKMDSSDEILNKLNNEILDKSKRGTLEDLIDKLNKK